MSDRMPEDMPDRMPEDLPDRMPEDMPDRMPDRMPEHMPEDMPEDMPDRMPEDNMSEYMPDRMPNRMPEDMSDRMPQDLPVRKCINVMVGITRSKVIFFPHLVVNRHDNYILPRKQEYRTMWDGIDGERWGSWRLWNWIPLFGRWSVIACFFSWLKPWLVGQLSVFVGSEFFHTRW